MRNELAQEEQAFGLFPGRTPQPNILIRLTGAGRRMQAPVSVLKRAGRRITAPVSLLRTYWNHA
jgi:hypothetical protein